MEREPLMEIKRMPYAITINSDPLKQEVNDVNPMSIEELEAQADMARDCLREVRETTATTCIDERERIGTQDGNTNIEPRFSVPGGANVYGLYIAELSGYFDPQSPDDSQDRLSEVTSLLNENEVKSGGHEGCAANGGFNTVLGLIYGDNLDAGKEYARSQLGDDFDAEIYDQVVEYARITFDSGRYANWDETMLFKELGDTAGQVIEQLNGKHEARTLLRVDVSGKTVDQTDLHKLSNGEDSFVNDEGYCQRIEDIISDGPDAEHKQKLARHAREAVLSAIIVAVPNKLLYQINISA